MKRPVSKERAESRVANRFRKLYVLLIELLDAVQDLEPQGMPVSDATIARKPDGGYSIAYHAHPARLVVIDGGKRYTLQVDEVRDGKN